MLFIQYEPKNCTFLKLIFSKPGVHLQEDGCTCISNYGTVRVTRISISSLILMHAKRTTL